MGCNESGCMKRAASDNDSAYWGSGRDGSDGEDQSDLHTVCFTEDNLNDEEELFDKLRAMEGWGDGRRAPSDGSDKSEPDTGEGGGPSVPFLVQVAKAKVACRSHELDQGELDRLNTPLPKKTLNFIRWWVTHVVTDLHQADSDLRPLPEGFYDPNDQIPHNVNPMGSVSSSGYQSPFVRSANNFPLTDTARKYQPGSFVIDNNGDRNRTLSSPSSTSPKFPSSTAPGFDRSLSPGAGNTLCDAPGSFMSLPLAGGGGLTDNSTGNQTDTTVDVIHTKRKSGTAGDGRGRSGVVSDGVVRHTMKENDPCSPMDFLVQDDGGDPCRPVCDGESSSGDGNAM